MKNMENKQQTAVEWYDQELRKCIMGTVPCDPIKILEQANKMFQEQIISANIAGMEFIAVDPTLYQQDAEQYYKETYGK
jgi:hypothetical protein